MTCTHWNAPRHYRQLLVVVTVTSNLNYIMIVTGPPAWHSSYYVTRDKLVVLAAVIRAALFILAALPRIRGLLL